MRQAAAEAGLELVEIWLESPSEYGTAFAAMRSAAEAVVIVPTPELYRDTEQFALLAVP